jgi:chromosome segregation ATPase
MSTPLPPQPKEKSCLERVFVIFIRLLFALILGVAIGVGIYFGATLLYGQYLTLTQDYESRITTLETQQSEAEETVTDRLSDFQTRLETLEVQGDTQKESLSDLESRLDSHEEFLSYQATAVMGQKITQEGIQETILALQSQIGVLQTDLEAIQTVLITLDDNITALETNTKNVDASLEAMNETVTTGEANLTALQHQMVLLQAMELLTRARLNLVQGNATLAESDIAAARDLLTALLPDLPPYQIPYVTETILMLEDTLTALPAAPLTAADKLESAWQMLAAGLPSEEEALAVVDAAVETDETEPDTTPSPTPTLDPSPTPTP